MFYTGKSSQRASWSRVSKKVNRKFVLVGETARANPHSLISQISIEQMMTRKMGPITRRASSQSSYPA